MHDLRQKLSVLLDKNMQFKILAIPISNGNSINIKSNIILILSYSCTCSNK